MLIITSITGLGRLYFCMWMK